MQPFFAITSWNNVVKLFSDNHKGECKVGFLKVLGWICIPYVMIFISWKRLKGTGKAFGALWASIAALMVVTNIASRESDQLILAPVTQTEVAVIATQTPIPSATTDPVKTDSTITTDEPVVTESLSDFFERRRVILEQEKEDRRQVRLNRQRIDRNTM